MERKACGAPRQRRALGARNAVMALVLLSFAFCSSCSLSSRAVDGNGGQIIANLQKQLPFTLVVPTYLPTGFLPYPTGVAGPSKGPASADSVQVAFGYQHRQGSDRHIWIVEENFPYDFPPSRPTALYLDIKGTKVLEEETELDTLHGFRYAWSQGGVSVQLNIYGYGTDEGRKVVSSMIR
jgi:hypothetical protein